MSEKKRRWYHLSTLIFVVLATGVLIGLNVYPTVHGHDSGNMSGGPLYGFPCKFMGKFHETFYLRKHKALFYDIGIWSISLASIGLFSEMFARRLITARYLVATFTLVAAIFLFNFIKISSSPDAVTRESWYGFPFWWLNRSPPNDFYVQDDTILFLNYLIWVAMLWSVIAITSWLIRRREARDR